MKTTVFHELTSGTDQAPCDYYYGDTAVLSPSIAVDQVYFTVATILLSQQLKLLSCCTCTAIIVTLHT